MILINFIQSIVEGRVQRHQRDKAKGTEWALIADCIVLHLFATCFEIRLIFPDDFVSEYQKREIQEQKCQSNDWNFPDKI